jgi:hypothetical protein
MRILFVGEFRKNLLPSKRRVWRNSWNEFSGWLNIWRYDILNMRSRSREPVKIRNLEPAKPWSHEPVKIWSLEPAKPWSREPVKIWNLESAKPWSREPVKIWNLESVNPRSREPVKAQSHEHAKLRNRESMKFRNLLKFKFGGYSAWRFPWIRDSWISKKPSQRRRFKSPGLMCELVAGL